MEKHYIKVNEIVVSETQVEEMVKEMDLDEDFAFTIDIDLLVWLILVFIRFKLILRIQHFRSIKIY
jgi:hypothetical protein